MDSQELYQRFLDFAQRCQDLIPVLPRTIPNVEYSKQLIRSSASPGSNYIEAIEASSRRDFIYRLKICKKETKESTHWCTLISHANENNKQVSQECELLKNEAIEIIKILSSSVSTAERNIQVSKSKTTKK